MVEAAHAGFFLGQYHFANTQRANRTTSGGLVDGDVSVHSHMVPPTQTHTPEDAELPLSSERGCTHVAAVTSEITTVLLVHRFRWNPVQVDSCPPADTHPSVCFVLCVWLCSNRWEELVLLYCSAYLKSSLSPGLQHRCPWCGRASCQVYVIKAADMNEAEQTVTQVSSASWNITAALAATLLA